MARSPWLHCQRGCRLDEVRHSTDAGEGASRAEVESLNNHEHMGMALSAFDSESFDWADARVIADFHADAILGG